MPQNLIQAKYQHWGQLTPDRYKELLLDFEKFCAEGSMITNKQGKVVPFKLNEAQRLVANQLLPFLFPSEGEEPKPVTIVIHKFRQAGISVLLAKLEQYVASRKRKLVQLHLLPTDRLASQFFQTKVRPIIEGTHTNLLATVTGSGAPTPHLHFHDLNGTDLDSFIYYAGSLAKASGRSTTNQVVIYDEYAYYTNHKELESGIAPTIPDKGFSLTVYVSTANAIDEFYDKCKLAQKDTNDMIYLFLPWYIQHEYEMDPQGRLAPENIDKIEFTEWEEDILDVFEREGVPENLWLRKLQWYDYTLETKTGNDLERMRREFPLTPDESFEASGKPVFPVKTMIEWLEDSPNHPFYNAEVVEKPGRRGIAAEFVVKKTPYKSPLRIYKEPDRTHRYKVSVDPAEGELENDASSFVVVDEYNLEEVACFQDNMPPEDVAEWVVGAAQYYNRAQVIVENNLGKHLIELIKNLNYNFFWYDPLKGRQAVRNPGTRMTTSTKKMAIDRMKFLINNNYYKVYDTETLQEMLHFNWTIRPSGYRQASATGSDEFGNPYHDDRVMARLNYVLTLNMARFNTFNHFNKEIMNYEQGKQ